MLHEAAGAQGRAHARSWPTSASPRRSSSTSASRAQFDTRDTERALAGIGHRGARRSTSYAEQALGLLGAQPRPRPLQGPLVRGRGQRAHGRHHRRLVGHRPAAAHEDRRGRRHPAARRARRWTSSRRPRPRSRRPAARRTPTRPTSPTSTRSTRSSSACSPTTPRSTCSSTTPGRSIRRSIALSLRPLPRLRAHDAAQLLRRDQADHGPAAAHARARLGPHRQRLLDRRADEPAALQRLRRLEGRARRVDARRRLRGRSATASPSRRSTCRSCARR